MLDWVEMHPFEFDLTGSNRKKLFRSCPSQKVAKYFFDEKRSKGYPLPFFRNLSVFSKRPEKRRVGKKATAGHFPGDSQAIGPALVKSSSVFTISLIILSEFNILSSESCLIGSKCTHSNSI